MKLLNENETQIVAGGECNSCMGKNRIVEIACYDQNKNYVQGWKVRPGEAWDCAKCFCCDRQHHYHALVSNRYYNCITQAGATTAITYNTTRAEDYPRSIANVFSDEL